MTRIHNRGLLIAGLILVTTGLVGGLVTGPGSWTEKGRGHDWMMGGSAGSAGGSPIRGAAEARVTATDFAFAPDEIAVSSGLPFNLTLVNQGAVPHDLVVAELDLYVEAKPGHSSTVGIAPPNLGRYSIVCTYPGHAAAGMRGTLVVES